MIQGVVDVLESFLRGGPLSSVVLALFQCPIEQLRKLDTSLPDHRRVWFLYELVMGVKLTLPCIPPGLTPQLPSLFPEGMFWTGEAPATVAWRHGLLINVPTCSRMLIVVRQEVAAECTSVAPLFTQLHAMPYEAEQRALNYLCTTEIKYSFAIEKGQPTASELAGLNQLITEFESDGQLTPERLQAVAQRACPHATEGYRTCQSWIGSAFGSAQLLPPPEGDVPWLMDSVFELYKRCCPSIVLAAVVSFLVLIIHPFEDGNGRTSRWILQSLLAKLDIRIPTSYAFHRDLCSYHEAIRKVWHPIRSSLGEPVIINTPTGYKVDALNDGCLFTCLDLTAVVQHTMSALCEASVFCKREMAYLDELGHAMEVLDKSEADTSRPGFEGLIALYMVKKNKFVHFIIEGSAEDKLFSDWSDEDYALFEETLAPLAQRWTPAHFLL
eukprot:TRINITY_DN30348_c0_g1_i1.p1 TRINITY_DN30348_c0_g1~~TRINITY_DN30348_c0_g1_i1.p1  ORF type:complete len:441 (+),score=48.29 TRINITY_DN30348_c0_g1_i1:50-1372(+)